MQLWRATLRPVMGGILYIAVETMMMFLSGQMSGQFGMPVLVNTITCDVLSWFAPRLVWLNYLMEQDRSNAGLIGLPFIVSRIFRSLCTSLASSGCFTLLFRAIIYRKGCDLELHEKRGPCQKQHAYEAWGAKFIFEGFEGFIQY